MMMMTIIKNTGSTIGSTYMQEFYKSRHLWVVLHMPISPCSWLRRIFSHCFRVRVWTCRIDTHAKKSTRVGVWTGEIDTHAKKKVLNGLGHLICIRVSVKCGIALSYNLAEKTIFGEVASSGTRLRLMCLALAVPLSQFRKEEPRYQVWYRASR